MPRKGPYAQRPKLPPHGDQAGCPAMDCRGGGSGMQSGLSDGQTARLPESTQEAIGSNGGARRCSYCGCVYLKSSRGILGWLDNGVLGAGWHGNSSAGI